jgi:hypothetical protein
MPDYDIGFKIVARMAGRELAELGGIHCQHWEPIGGEVQATERLADRAFRASSGRDRFVVYMEAYARWDRAAPWNILAKSGLLSERERLSTLCLLYILTRRGYRPQGGTMRLELATGPTQQLWFKEICLWEQVPHSWWEQLPGLMTLYPLCRHPERSRRAVLTHAAGVIKEQVAERNRRADLLVILGFFGRMAYSGMDVVQLIGREQMKESPLYQEILAEGREEGRVETRRSAIQEVLEARFDSESITDIVEELTKISDLPRLAELLQLASRCRRLADFRREFDL